MGQVRCSGECGAAERELKAVRFPDLPPPINDNDSLPFGEDRGHVAAQAQFTAGNGRQLSWMRVVNLDSGGYWSIGNAG